MECDDACKALCWSRQGRAKFNAAMKNKIRYETNDEASFRGSPILSVIPGRRAATNPESRDFPTLRTGPSDHRVVNSFGVARYEMVHNPGLYFYDMLSGALPLP